MAICLIVCWVSLSASSCLRPVYMPVEDAYDKQGKLRTDGHYVKDDYLRKLDDDIKACGKR